MLEELNQKVTVSADNELSEIHIQEIRKNALPGVEQVIRGLEQYFLSFYHPDACKFNKFVVDFIEDIHGSHVFLQVKAFDL
jgi:hypothetical protein